MRSLNGLTCKSVLIVRGGVLLELVRVGGIALLAVVVAAV